MRDRGASLQRRLGAQPAGHLVAVHAGQADVEQDHLGRKLARPRRSAAARRAPRDLVAPKLAAASPGCRRRRALSSTTSDARPAAVRDGALGGGAAGADVASPQQRQADDELAALARPSLRGLDAAAVQLDQAAYQREADAEAALRARPALGRPG